MMSKSKGEDMPSRGKCHNTLLPSNRSTRAPLYGGIAIESDVSGGPPLCCPVMPIRERQSIQTNLTDSFLFARWIFLPREARFSQCYGLGWAHCGLQYLMAGSILVAAAIATEVNAAWRYVFDRESQSH